jgi:phosphoribosylamine--glycine ligase
MKKILLIGGGAREHALGLALKNDARSIELFVWSGNLNPGLAALAAGMRTGSMTDVQGICTHAQEIKADFVVVGPEGPLALGLVDLLEEAGIPAIGPQRELAQLESSKTFTRELLREYGIPGSPAYRSFTDETGLADFLDSLSMGFVIKPDGLTGGKGVKVMGDHFSSREEGMEIIRELLAEVSQVLIEEKLIGQEFSLMSFCDGKHFLHMPAVQDHKRAFDGDTGPNTGGMGTYSMADGSLPFLQTSDIAAAKAINEAVGLALRKKCGKPYRGVLYGGFMATSDGIRLIEYNARLGDPEAMNVLSLLPGRDEGGSFLQICEAMLEGRLHEVSVQWKSLSTVCKYAVPDGYPDAPLKGLPLDVSEVNQEKVRLFYASVEEKDGVLLLVGSRAVAVLAMHEDLREAARMAEDEISKIKGPVFHRRDIGTAELISQRVRMMESLRIK